MRRIWVPFDAGSSTSAFGGAESIYLQVSTFGVGCSELRLALVYFPNLPDLSCCGSSRIWGFSPTDAGYLTMKKTHWTRRLENIGELYIWDSTYRYTHVLLISWCLVSESLLWKFVQVMVPFLPCSVHLFSLFTPSTSLFRFHTSVVVHSNEVWLWIGLQATHSAQLQTERNTSSSTGLGECLESKPDRYRSIHVENGKSWEIIASCGFHDTKIYMICHFSAEISDRQVKWQQWCLWLLQMLLFMLTIIIMMDYHDDDDDDDGLTSRSMTAADLYI